ncbi:MAG: carboxypeptidase-like regulatory domain-containing protein, partial [Xanthomonadales bacterium]
TTLTNTARVYWDDLQQQAEASVSIDVGAMPNAGTLSGQVWHDADHDNTPGTAEQALEGWTVELWLNGELVRTTLSDADGNYIFGFVPPNYAAGETYSLRFSAPGATAMTALLGETDSDFTDGLQRIDDIDVQEGSNLLALNLPVDPNGVVYDSIGRSPVAGAIVSLVDPRNELPLPADCFDDPKICRRCRSTCRPVREPWTMPCPQRPSTAKRSPASWRPARPCRRAARERTTTCICALTAPRCRVRASCSTTTSRSTRVSMARLP